MGITHHHTRVEVQSETELRAWLECTPESIAAAKAARDAERAVVTALTGVTFTDDELEAGTKLGTVIARIGQGKKVLLPVEGEES